ncbi:MAG: hypothetical protein JWR77_2421, partial [Rhizorhabdus sp.]|nr:hypothetical protein [Rhizorhabdus sp.]
VVNRGTITGTWDGVATNGDGDGVDIDLIGSVHNYGTIQGLSAAGVDSGGQPNSAEGIAIGGGTIINEAGALISGGGAGILVDDGSAGSAAGATSITNAGTIRGVAGSGIVLVGDFADTITTSGAIAGGNGIALNMGAGDDTLNVASGASFTGTIDGGAGTDRIALSGAAGGSFAGSINFETLQVASGNWLLSGTQAYANGIGVAAGATATGNAAVLGSNAIANAGALVFDQAANGSFAGTISGAGTVTKAGSGNLTIGAQSYTGATNVAAGTLTLTGALASPTYAVAAGATLTSALATTITSSGATLNITNNGTISTSNTSGRAINVSGANNNRTITLVNNIGAVIQSADDAFRINVNPTGGAIRVDNFGIIRTTNGGQALDFDAAASGGASIVINNYAGAELRAFGQDAIRPGQGAVVTNAGLIFSDGPANNSYDGVDWQGKSGVVVNQTGGTISGLRHGITSDVDVNVTNQIGATITGRNGSGVGSDGTGTVVNAGTITGTWDGVATNGDGDGVDIDLIGTVRNAGTIRGIRAAGVDSGGRPNSAEGIAMGGGTIDNMVGGLISGGGTGILIDDGANGSAYGATTITNAGTIEGLAGPAIALVGNFADSIINSGTITGTGGTAIQMGGGDDRLTLLVGSSISGAVDGGSGTDTVVLGGAGSGSFAGAINFEQLSVTSGLWALTGAATFSGGTTIGGSRLNVGAALASAVTVGNGGTLGGTGSVSSVLVQSGGTIAPGTGIGTLTVTGNLVQAAGSTYAAETGGAVSDRIVVGGTATIQSGVTLAVTRGNGETVGTRYTVLTATGGVTGTYSTFTQSAFGGTELRLGANANSIFVDVARTAGSLPSLARNRNQAGAVAAVAGLGVANGAYAALTLIPSDDAVRAGLDQLAGEVHASAQTAMVGDANLAQRTVIGRIAEAGASKNALWGEGVIGRGENDGVNGGASADRDTTGGIGGVDLGIGDASRIGIAGGYTRDKLKIAERDSRAKLKTVHVLGYAGTDIGNIRVRAVGGYAWAKIKSRRDIDFGGFADLATAKYDGETLHGSLDVGYAIPALGGTVEPFAGAAAWRIKTDGFVENGGASALRGAAGKQSFLRSQLGLRFDTPVTGTISARGSAAWQHAFDDITPQSVLAFAGGGASFGVNGTTLSREAAAASLSVVWAPSAKVKLSAGYDGLIGDHGSDNTGRIRLSIGL